MALVGQAVQRCDQFLRRDRRRVLERYPRAIVVSMSPQAMVEDSRRPRRRPLRSDRRPIVSTSPSPRRHRPTRLADASECSMLPTLVGWRPCSMALAEKLTGCRSMTWWEASPPDHVSSPAVSWLMVSAWRLPFCSSMNRYTFLNRRPGAFVRPSRRAGCVPANQSTARCPGVGASDSSSAGWGACRSPLPTDTWPG